MPEGDYIAIDWGTTNRRIFVMRADGHVLHSQRDDRGVLAVPAGSFGAEIAGIRAQFGDLPIITAGMIGSSRGLVEVPYRPAPATIADLAAGAFQGPDRVCVVPGVSATQGRHADVMRGEEVQVLGALASGIAKGPALFCQPGTHNKWIETDARSITGIATAMTGELFALLKQHSVLNGMLDAEVADGDAFRDGLARGAGATDLPTALFQVRAAILLGLRSRDDAASYASGILIGADVGSRADIKGREIVLLSSGILGDLYTAAIEWAGGTVHQADSHAAFTAGIHAIWKEIA